MEYSTAALGVEVRRNALAAGHKPGHQQRGAAAFIHGTLYALLIAVALLAGACRHAPPKRAPDQVKIEPLGFQITSGADHYQIEGYFAHTTEVGRVPALLVLNGNGGDALQC